LNKKKSITSSIKIDNKRDLIAFFGISESKFNYYFRKVKGKKNYRELTINKASGKPRTIHAVSPRLKKIQRIALEKLQKVKRFQPSNYAHGFVPEKSIITNAICHRKSKRIIKMDLKDFFTSIHFGRVRGMFMAYPFEFGKDAATIMAQLSCLDDATGILPQGGSLSPYIANMMCRRLDKKLAQVARDHRCHFTRYADDITFSTNDVSQENIDDLIKETGKVIESEYFVVNTDKTKVLTPEDRQVVTGIIVNDGININRRYIRNLRATIRNCEKFGIASQIERKIFRDIRCSRPNKFASNNHPSVDYFLRHILGKINHFGSVVLSNNQDQKNLENPGSYKRIQTYENILYRFYDLLKKSKVEVDPSIARSALSAIYRRPKLAAKLSIIKQGKAVRKKTMREFGETSKFARLHAELDSIDTVIKLGIFIKKMGEKDPRFFNRPIYPNIEKAKNYFKGILDYPSISLDKTERILKSLMEPGGLKNLVHSGSGNFSVNDCYEILSEYYEPVFYYLPKYLQNEFEKWKGALGEILQKHGESHYIDVIHDPIIADATKILKINTRFGGNPADSSNLKKEVQSLTDNINLESDRVEILIKSSIGFFTHVPSILNSIEDVLKSMLNHTDKVNKIFINLSKTKDKKNIELIIFNNSKKGVHNELFDDRSFVHGKMSTVVRLTNGLCKYWIEATLENGDRKVIDMHNGSKVNTSELSDLKHGFAHRFIFKK
jgi:hypothetical protein